MPTRLLPSTLLLMILATFCSLSGATPTGRLSEEQAAHQKDMDRCFSLLAEAGAKWYQGDQVGKMCEQQHPPRPERARQEIMAALAKSGLASKDAYSPYLMADGDCKRAGMKYILLNEDAYKLNEGAQKNRVLAEAKAIRDAVLAGKCPVIK